MKKSDASPFTDRKKTTEKVFQKTEPRKITEKQQGSTPLNKLFVKKMGMPFPIVSRVSSAELPCREIYRLRHGTSQV